MLEAFVDTHASSHQSWRVIVQREWYIWGPVTVAIYVFVNGYYSGWTSWLTPNTAIPLLYSADALFIAPYMQRQLEGDWYFESLRMGYPFVATLYDFPSTFAEMSLLTLMQWAWPSWIEAYHWWYVISYVLVFVVTYVVFRHWRIQPLWAVIGALAFDFMPFHHDRIAHPYFFWYFIVPIVFAYGWKFWQGQLLRWRHWSSVGHVLLFGAIGTFYVYWAVMSSAVILVASAIGSSVHRNWRIALQGVVLTGCMIAGLLLSYFPSLQFAQQYPTNMPLVREVEDSEKFALWPIALLTPAPAHTPLGQAYQQFLDNQGLPSEHNVNAFLSALGLVIALGAFAWQLIGRQAAAFLRFCAVMVIGLTLYAAVGGLGLSVSLYVTSLIRATNRIIVFISFAGIATAIYAIQYMQRTYAAQRPWLTWGVASVLLVVIWFDSPMAAGPYRNADWHSRMTAWEQERQFFVESEQALGVGAAVYQLPALFFPEGDMEPAYGQMRCFLFTRMLCSHGDVFGRDGYLFYRELQHVPMQQQLAIVARLGFDGVMISRNYYRENPRVEQDLVAQLGSPVVVSADQSLALYRVFPTGPKIPGRTLTQIVAESGFLQDTYQIRQQTAITTPIDFWRPWLPQSVRYVRGLYDAESRGRWNDGKSARHVTIVFSEPLPPKFRLDITALAWGRSVGAPVQVVVGPTTAEMRFGHELSTQSVTLTNPAATVQLTLVPPFRERASAQDYRYLSFLLHQMTITPIQ
ncbi:MAG: hypothetical protein RI985_1895 [Chloroflexota bacterium]